MNRWYDRDDLAMRWYYRVVVAYGCVAAVYIVLVLTKIVVGCFL